MRNGWCGGRASLFWVRGTTGMELILDKKDFIGFDGASVKTVHWYSLQNAVIIHNNYIIYNSCFRYYKVQSSALFSFASCCS